VGRFSDPVAISLLRPEERELVRIARAGVAPGRWGALMEYEMLRRTADVMAARTVVIDDAVREAGHPQLVVLGAGLDARAWRMPELAESVVLEVDRPASQHDKQARLGDREPLAASVRFVPVDFTRDDLCAALERAGHESDRPTTWLWGGVVPYLRREEVAATLASLATRSATGSRAVVNYVGRSLVVRPGRMVAAVLTRLAGARSPWADEPWRSTWSPQDMAKLLGQNGFQVLQDTDPDATAAELGLPTRSLTQRHNRVVVAERMPEAEVIRP
jgi:methyltransferase (TIGR00027 family)